MQQSLVWKTSRGTRGLSQPVGGKEEGSGAAIPAGLAEQRRKKGERFGGCCPVAAWTAWKGRAWAQEDGQDGT